MSDFPDLPEGFTQVDSPEVSQQNSSGDSFPELPEGFSVPHQQQEETTSLGGEFVGGLKAGFGQTKALLTEAAPALFFDVIGNEEKSKKEFEQYQNTINKIAETNPSSWQDATGIKKGALMTARLLGEGIAPLATSLAGGGVGLLAKGAVGAGVAAFGTSYALNTPESYVNLLENEADNPEYWSLGVGALKTGLDFVPLNNLYRKTFGRAGNDVITSKVLSKAGFKEASKIVGKQAAEQFALEGITEAAQEAADVAAEELLGKYPEGFFSKENLHRIALAGYAGALAGGVAGGGAGIVRVAGAEKKEAAVPKMSKEDVAAFVQEHEVTLQEMLDETPIEQVEENRLVKTQKDAEQVLETLGIPVEEIPTGLRKRIADRTLKETLQPPPIPNISTRLKLLSSTVPLDSLDLMSNDILTSLRTPDDLLNFGKTLENQEIVRMQKVDPAIETFYHGTKNEIKEFSEDVYGAGSEQNFYGPGLYTTNSQGVASKYGKGNFVYAIEDQYPMSMYDMERPIEGTKLYNFLEDSAETNETIDTALSDLGTYSKTPNLRNFYDALRDASDDLGLPAYETQETMADISDWLSSNGYDGMTHKGGLLTNTAPHTVKIYFDPKNQVKKADVSDTVYKRDSLASSRNGNEQLWDINENTLKGTRLKESDITPKLKQQMEAIGNAVKVAGGKNLKIVFMKDLFAFNQENQTLENPVRGAQLGNIIYIALQSTDPTVSQNLEPLEASYHETWHYLYDERTDVFSEKDKQIIEAQYPQIEKYLEKHFGILPQDVKALYSVPEGKSEVIATLFGNYAVAKGANRNLLPQVLRPYFNKALNIIKALGRGLRGQGFSTFESIFDRVIEGAMAPTVAMKQALNDTQVARLQKTSEGIAKSLRNTAENSDFQALLEERLDHNFIVSQQEGHWGLEDQVKHGAGYFLTASHKSHWNRLFSFASRVKQQEEAETLAHLNAMEDRAEMYYKAPNDIKIKAGEILRHLSDTEQDFKINSQGQLEYYRGNRLVRVTNPEMVNILTGLRQALSYPLEEIDFIFRKWLNNYVDNAHHYAPRTLKKHITDELKELEDKTRGVTKADKDRISDLKKAKGLAENLEAIRKMLKKSYFPDVRFGKYVVVVRRVEDLTPSGRAKPDTEPVYFSKIPEGRHLGKFDKQAHTEVMAEVEQYRNNPEYQVYDPFIPTNDQYFDIVSQSFSSLDAMMNLLGSSENAEQYRIAIDAISEKIKAKGYDKRFLEKKRIKGASKDYLRVVDNHIKSSAHYLSKQNNSDKYALLENFARKIGGSKDSTERGKALYKDYRSYVDYIQDPSQEYQHFTTFNFMMTMGFNLSTSALQYMTVPTYTLGSLSQFNPNVIQNMATIAKATKDIHSQVLGDKEIWVKKNGMYVIKFDSPEFLASKNLTADEKEMFKWFYNSVHSGDLFIEEMTGESQVDKKSLGQKATSTFGVIKNYSGVPISVSEQLTRATSALAIYRTLRKTPDAAGLASRMLGVNAPNPDEKWITLRATSKNPLLIDLVGYLVDDVHAVFGKRGRGKVYRGLGRIILPFMQYPMSMNELMFRMAKRGPEGRRALAVTLGSLFFFAGAIGLPGAELLKELLEEVYKMAKGQNIDIDREFRIAFNEMTRMPNLGTSIMQGFPRGFGGIDIGGRLRQPAPAQDILFALSGVRGDTSNLLGVQGSYVANLLTGVNEWINGGSPMAVGAMTTPTAMANFFKAFQYMDEGVRTRKGSQLLTPEEVKEAPIRNVFLRMLGIGSAQVAGRREEQYWQNLVNTQYDPKMNTLRNRASNISVKIADEYLKGDSRNQKKIQELQKDYQTVMQDLSNFLVANQIPYNVSAFNRSVFDKVKQRLQGGTLIENYDKIVRDQHNINKIITNQGDFYYKLGY